MAYQFKIGKKSNKGTDVEDELLKLLQYAQEADVEPPQSLVQKGASLFDKLAGFLSAGETAPAVMAQLRGESPISAYASSVGSRATGGGLGENISYADVLEEVGVGELGSLNLPVLGKVTGRGAVGLAGDILLDPATYLSLGISALGKTAGKKTLTEATEAIAKKIAKEAGEEVTPAIMKQAREQALKRSDVLGRTAVEQVEKGQRSLLNFMGQPIVPKSTSRKFYQTATDVGKKIGQKAEEEGLASIPGKTYKVLDQLFSGKMKPLAKWGDPEFAEQWNKLLEAERASKNIKAVAAGEAETIAKSTTKKLRELLGGSKDLDEYNKVMKEIHDYYEKNTPLEKIPENLRGIVEDMRSVSKPFTERWKAAGGSVMPWDNVEYLTRVQNPLFEKVAKSKGGYGARWYTSQTPSDVHRKWLKIIPLSQPKGAGLVDDLAKEARKYKSGVVGHIDELKRKYKLEEFVEDGVPYLKNNKGEVFGIQGATAKEINKKTMEDYGVELFSTNIPVIQEVMAKRVGNKEAGKQFFDMVKEIGVVAEEAPQGWRGLALRVGDDAPDLVKSTAKELNNSKLVFPKEIAERIDAVYKAYLTDDGTKAVANLYDEALNFWKGSVTSIFPAFHGRNMLSNMWQNYLGGVKSPSAYKKAGVIRAKVATNAPLSKSEQELWDRFTKQGLVGYGYFGKDVARHYFTDVAPRTTAQKVKGAIPGMMEQGRKFGNVVEDTAKLAHFIDKINKGFSDVKAAESVRKYLFDYADLTPFEKNVMKRVAPFYSFSRKNLPMELEALATQPGKFSNLIKGMRAGGFELQGAEYLPEWLRDSPVTKTTTPEGEERYGYGYDIPAFDILNFLEQGEGGGIDIRRSFEKSVGRMASPFIKGPAEWMSGKHWYYGKDLEDTATVYPIAAKALKAAGIADELGIREEKTKDGETYYKTSNPETWHVFQSLFGRLYSTVGRIDVEEGAEERLRNLLFGVKTKPIDPQEAEDARNYEMVKRLGEFLKRRGVLREFSRYYKPKE